MTAGLFMGFLSYIGTMFLWKSMPRFLKMWSLRHPIISDFVVGFVTLYSMSMFSTSIICMVATVTAPLMMQFTLMYLATPGGRKLFHLEEKKKLGKKTKLFFD